MLSHPGGSTLTNHELKNLDDNSVARNVGTEVVDLPKYRVPPRKQAIAGVLISEWAYGKVTNKDVNPGDVKRSRI